MLFRNNDDNLVSEPVKMTEDTLLIKNNSFNEKITILQLNSLLFKCNLVQHLFQKHSNNKYAMCKLSL